MNVPHYLSPRYFPKITQRHPHQTQTGSGCAHRNAGPSAFGRTHIWTDETQKNLVCKYKSCKAFSFLGGSLSIRK